MIFDNIEEKIYSSQIQESLAIDAVDSKTNKKPCQKRKTIAKADTPRKTKKIKDEIIGDYCI
jgi:hypothetical protein